jgi:hypothetical protein
MDGDETIWSLSAVSVNAVTDADGNVTDTSTTGSTGVTLTQDAKGALYITKGENNIAIVDSNDVAVNFDWQDNWGSQTHTAKSWAVEGIDSNSDNTIDKYKLAVKHTFVDKNSSETDVQWETFEIATTGVVDWNSGTWGDIKIHESDLNQNLDGSEDGIWSLASQIAALSQISTDNKGALGFLDSEKNLYVSAGEGETKQQVLDYSGSMITFNESYSYGDFSFDKEVIAVTDSTIGNTEYYQALIKGTETFDKGLIVLSIANS